MENFYKKFKIEKIKNLSIENLEISTVLFVFLKNIIGIKTLDELSEKTEKEIAETHGCNPHLMKELKLIMSENGIFFKE